MTAFRASFLGQTSEAALFEPRAPSLRDQLNDRDQALWDDAVTITRRRLQRELENFAQHQRRFLWRAEAEIYREAREAIFNEPKLLRSVPRPAEVRAKSFERATRAHLERLRGIRDQGQAIIDDLTAPLGIGRRASCLQATGCASSPRERENR